MRISIYLVAVSFLLLHISFAGFSGILAQNTADVRNSNIGLMSVVMRTPGVISAISSGGTGILQSGCNTIDNYMVLPFLYEDSNKTCLSPGLTYFNPPFPSASGAFHIVTRGRDSNSRLSQGFATSSTTSIYNISTRGSSRDLSLTFGVSGSARTVFYVQGLNASVSFYLGLTKVKNNGDFDGYVNTGTYLPNQLGSAQHPIVLSTGSYKVQAFGNDYGQTNTGLLNMWDCQSADCSN